MRTFHHGLEKITPALDRRAKSQSLRDTGRDGGDMPPLCDLCLRAPSDSTPLIQQLHITAGHIVCGLVEARLFPRTGASAAAK